jgi:hypothetical protein
MARKSKAELLLERAAERGSATAAVELSRMHARAERAKRGLNPTQTRAAERDAKKQATAVSRARNVIGPEHREGYAARMLANLLDDDPDPAEAAWLADAEAEYAAAYAVFPWPDFPTNPPKEGT